MDRRTCARQEDEKEDKKTGKSEDQEGEKSGGIHQQEKAASGVESVLGCRVDAAKMD